MLNLTGMKPEEILSLLISEPSSLLSDLGIKNDFDTAYQKLLETPSMYGSISMWTEQAGTNRPRCFPTSLRSLPEQHSRGFLINISKFPM